MQRSRYEGQVPAGLAVSSYVQYVLTPPAQHLVWWLAVHSPTGAVVGVGVGTALMQAVETWLKRRPAMAQTVGLGVESDNSIAIALYTSLGYTIAARGGVPITFAGGSGKPCNVMFKPLNADEG